MGDAGLAQLPSGALVHDRYLIIRPVGQGGLSTVYQVSDTQAVSSHVFALKEQRDLSQGARKQFAREAGWLKALDHPHIPKVTAFFEWHGLLYLVMEFIAGENLEQKLERAGGRPLPEAQVLPWVLPICDALNYLHTRVPPILHRDVKPANIIVTPTGRPVLVDLGIAKEHGPVASKTATFVRKAGTEGYAPPEQYAAAGLSGPWSDVYGFGATVYHLLTAQIPPTAVERVALDAHLAPPSTYNLTVSATTDLAIMRALAIRPQDRYPSLLPLKAALQAGSTSEPQLPATRAQVQSPTLSRSGAPPNVGNMQAALRVRDTAGQAFASARDTFGPSQARMAASGPVSATSTAASPRSTGKRAAPATMRMHDPASEDAGARSAEGGRAIYWWAALVVTVLIGVAAAAFVLHVYTPLDRSTPTATVNGYFEAVKKQDYSRAWEYLASSANNPTAQTAVVQNARADDALYGKVLEMRIATTQGGSSAHETVIVMVTRAGARGEPVRETVQLTQYSGNWLIDSISAG